MRNVKSLVLAAVAMGLLTAPLDAHAVWFAQRAKQTALIYGVGADDLDAVKRFTFIEKMTGYDANYQPIKATPRIAGPIVLVDTEQQPTLLSVVFFMASGRAVGDGEWEKKGRDEMPNATISTKNYKYSVAIMGPLDKPVPALSDQVLQIVPAGPIPKTMGEKLTYKVLFRGKPVAGAKIINDLINDPDATPIETAADGTVTMTVRNQGLNVLHAVYKGPTDDPKRYDWIENTATLSFVLPHQPE